MGKALIVSGGTDGQYTIGLNFARARIDAEIAALGDTIADISEWESDLREKYDYAKLTVEEIWMAVHALINDYEERGTAASTAGLVAAHNAIRSSKGLPTLTENAALTSAAQGHADFLRDNDTRGHTGAGGSTPVQRAVAAGYAGVRVGENAACGPPTLDVVMEEWMRSSGHRANIIDGDYDQIGVGYAFCPGGLYWHFWVVVFGQSA